MVRTINITVRDLASECPMRKILSLKRSKMELVQIGGQKTGHDLEELVGNIVVKNFDATTEYSVTLKKRIGNINFIIRGKLDILIRKHNPDGTTTYQVVELKYDPLFRGKPKKEHIRQVSIYAEILKRKENVKNVEAYLQYWLAQTPALAKFTTLVQNYPEDENPFVKTYKIENTREVFNEAIFDLARAIAWANNFPGISPTKEEYCLSCPYHRACNRERHPEYRKIYNAITYEKYRAGKISLKGIPKDELGDAKNYIKEVVAIAKNLKI